MAAGGLDGPGASPKGLRHGFGVAGVSAGIPLNLVQNWLGHAQLTTTAMPSVEEQSIGCGEPANPPRPRSVAVVRTFSA